MSSRSYDCPSCGAAVPFASSIAVSAVCEFCRSIVVRRGVDVESMGVLAELPPDLTPLQPGTRGEWKGRGFTLIGRLRVEWDGGSWNEWCADFGNGAQGWVAEAQGFCMVSFREEAPELAQAITNLNAGAQHRLAGRAWTVVDNKIVRCQSGEGQLPFAFDAQWQRLSVDLIGGDGAFGSIEQDDEGLAFFSGAYVRYEDLKLENMRPVPGWSADVETTRNQSVTLGCPTCGAAVNLRAAGQSMSAVCGSCGSVIDTANPHLQLIQKASEQVSKVRPALPIGTRGRLFDVEYEVVGCVVRKDRYSKWQELLLFNPWHGFDWLVTYRGHWSFVRRAFELGNESGPRVSFQRQNYQLFAKGNASVSAVLGEFYWKVQRGETAELSDWIRPPFILSKETYPGLNEFTWSHGVYVEHTRIAEAFGVKNLPAPSGMYLNQPNPHAERWRSLKPWAALFLGLYLVIQIVFAARIVSSPVFESEFLFARVPGEPVKTVTSPTFELKGGSQPVWITARAPVSNNWLGLDVDLVNAQTNETFTVPVTVEYYYGVDGGESWSEGSQRETEALAAIPPGQYFLNIDADADPAIPSMKYQVSLVRGGVFWSNFWTGLVLLLLYPISVWFRHGAFETARWNESDFTAAGGANTSDD